MKTDKKGRYRMGLYIDPIVAHKIRMEALKQMKSVSRYIEDVLKSNISLK